MKFSSDYIESIKKISNLDIEKLEKSFDKEPPVGVRFNQKKLKNFDFNQENIENLLKKYDIFGNFIQIPWCEQGFSTTKDLELGKSVLHEIGLFYLQEPSAMSPVEFLNIEDDDVVLDLCAAPGGKSTQIASKLKNGFLVSNEIVPQRAKILCENVQRLGLDNVIVLNHSPKELEERFENFFDKILVDAPCSGEGMFRKNNDAIAEWTKDTPKSCATRQKEILKSAIKMLKPNGTLVYSTCTFSLEENEEVIKFVLDEYPDMRILPVEHKKYCFENGIDLDNTNRLTNCARLYPYNLNGEGHFFAVLKKIDENETILVDKNSNFKKNKFQANKQKVKIFEDWFCKYSNKKFDNFCLIGDYLYANCPIDIDKLKVVNAGLLLGEFKKDNFVPSLHLARSLSTDDFSNKIELTFEQTKKYLQGLEIETNFKNDWVMLTYKNFPICFGKVVNGKIKNHYPKQLRKSL